MYGGVIRRVQPVHEQIINSTRFRNRMQFTLQIGATQLFDQRDDALHFRRVAVLGHEYAEQPLDIGPG